MKYDQALTSLQSACESGAERERERERKRERARERKRGDVSEKHGENRGDIEERHLKGGEEGERERSMDKGREKLSVPTASTLLDSCSTQSEQGPFYCTITY